MPGNISSTCEPVGTVLNISTWIPRPTSRLEFTWCGQVFHSVPLIGFPPYCNDEGAIREMSSHDHRLLRTTQPPSSDHGVTIRGGAGHRLPVNITGFGIIGGCSSIPHPPRELRPAQVLRDLYGSRRCKIIVVTEGYNTDLPFAHKARGDVCLELFEL